MFVQTQIFGPRCVKNSGGNQLLMCFFDALPVGCFQRTELPHKSLSISPFSVHKLSGSHGANKVNENGIAFLRLKVDHEVVQGRINASQQGFLVEFSAF